MSDTVVNVQNLYKYDFKTKDITDLVPLEIMEHYKNIHLDLDLLFVNKVTFLLEKSRDIHCKAILTKSDKQVQIE